jgi:anti-sigma B factor antagonist
MNIGMKKERGTVILSIEGRMDVVTSPVFQERAEDLLAQGERAVIIDCGGLEYISSAGLRSILVISKKLKEVGGRLALSGLQDSVREVFDISGFSSVIPIHPSLDAALTGGNYR